jgi:hypothetical protein
MMREHAAAEAESGERTDETQVIHLALHAMATQFLPQYEPDEGALTKTQLNQLKKSAPKAKGGTIRSTLFEIESA